LVKLPEGGHVHLVGICGTAMAGLAGLLRARGYRVTGSDEGVYPPMSTWLESLGIRADSGFDARHLRPDPDLVVIGNAIRRGNPEAEDTLDRRLPFTSLPVLVKELLLPGKRPAVVAGTHGKTTTSSMLAHILEATGADPSFLIGGIPLGAGAPSRLGRGDVFVLEGDEYDTAFFDKGPKLMHYLPDVAVLNAVEMDHADIYRDLEMVMLQFRRWVNIIPRRSLLLVHGDDANAVEVTDKALCRVERFGEGPANEWRIDAMDDGPLGTTFTLIGPRGKIAVSLPTAGAFNARNAVAAIVAAQELGVPLPRAALAMASFPGVRRRLEVKGEAGGVVVVDDFAHHPTAVRETLRAARSRWPGRRIIGILEPRSWSLRRNLFQAELATALACADRVAIAAVFHGEALAAEERLDVPRLVREIAALGVPATSGEGAKEIVAELGPELREGDVVLVMSNGGFGGIHERLLDSLAARPAGAV
jgi:UDP-N-acetylmuramate: L-alanyl-gamma-D-glutamyl-meso-diaminopimelate ligase